MGTVNPSILASPHSHHTIFITMAFQFQSCIVCELPDSYSSSALGLSSSVDMVKARYQWSQYVSVLESLGCHVTVLPADERFPDCVFVEDTAVIVKGHALLTQPGDPSRRDEIENMRPILVKQGLVVMKSPTLRPSWTEETSSSQGRRSWWDSPLEPIRKEWTLSVRLSQGSCDRDSCVWSSPSEDSGHHVLSKHILRLQPVRTLHCYAEED